MAGLRYFSEAKKIMYNKTTGMARQQHYCTLKTISQPPKPNLAPPPSKEGVVGAGGGVQGGTQALFVPPLPRP